MNNKILEQSNPVTLVGGGALLDRDLRAALALAPTCVAADGGAEAVLAAGVPLAAVIGDMDSISQAALARIPPECQHRITEQDSTDFDKALRHISAPLVLAVGFCGRRIDHQLAALHTLVMRSDACCLMVGDEDVIFLCPPLFEMPMEPGTRVSLFPMGAVTGRSDGLEWPIDGLAFAPDGQSGTSNRATGRLRLEVDAPALLCILPRASMAAAAETLLALPRHARWPARAAPHKAPPAS
ncbi:thiamine pyrophosphokinase [Roseobacter cerasinus]|uniref:Thiamine diphosphokinase n=1 Tax=Roseobacter cerasinus TaxID=2602289 RepID=A0A640VPF3_9RHOB|nr:thiamine diphosphokinase [Roseobacter cerasinus]GFE48765.1 thiamine pyrophosphokinase [Roseobacter cerasinus]